MGDDDFNLLETSPILQGWVDVRRKAGIRPIDGSSVTENIFALCGGIARSTLADANERRDWRI